MAATILLAAPLSFGSGAAQLKIAESDEFGCELLLANPPLLPLAQPLFRSVDQLTDDYPGMKVVDFFAMLHRQRDEFITAMRIKAEFLSPALKESVEKNIERFRFAPYAVRDMTSAIERYGEENIPVGPVPLSNEVYEVWGPRFREFRSASLSTDQFGQLGEFLVASALPGVEKVNIGPHQLFDVKTQGRIMSGLSLRDRQWLGQYKKSNFEIDVLFRDGRAVGEIKMFKSEYGRGTDQFEKVERQAQKLRRLLDIYAELGYPKESYFIFFGVAPGAEMRSIIEAYGHSIRTIPYNFGGKTKVRLNHEGLRF